MTFFLLFKTDVLRAAPFLMGDFDALSCALCTLALAAYC